MVAGCSPAWTPSHWLELAGGQWGTPEPFYTATARRLWDSPCLRHCTDFLCLGHEEDAFALFPGTLKLFSFPITHEMANGFTPLSNHQPGCPPGATWVLFQADVPTWGALPNRSASPNTVVTKCLQHGREKTCCFPLAASAPNI